MAMPQPLFFPFWASGFQGLEKHLIEVRGEELPLVDGAIALSVPKGKIVTTEVA